MDAGGYILQRVSRWVTRPTVSTEMLGLIASAYFAIVSSRLFWVAALQGQASGSSAWLRMSLVLLVALVSLHLFLLCIVLTRRTTRILLALLLVTSAVATYFMGEFGVYLTPAMLRNALHTESGEARELLSLQLLWHVLLEGGLPALLLWWVRIRPEGWPVAACRRTVALTASASLLFLAVLFGYQDLAPLMRNHKEVRYLVTPANYLYSLTRSLSSDAARGTGTVLEVGTDARLGPGWAPKRKPVLLVIVVGETARAANWGLNGYARQTNPELVKLPIINFPTVDACGSDTETSLPCMFSAIGRRDYDESRIRRSQSLLHVVKRAGFDVVWRDNQTGCKGVCAGLEYEQADQLDPDGCPLGSCLDEVLLHGLQARWREDLRNRVVVLHQLGNHGPAYYKRYPDAFRQFTPTCDTAEIRTCSIEQITNSYDNALLYTDHFLAQTIALLKEEEAYDTALLYLSDHGESLGENGLFLHGIPYAIAPQVQTAVPMVLWLSQGFLEESRLDQECIRKRSDSKLSHDFLFHTVLGLLQVETAVHDGRYDLSAGCRYSAPWTQMESVSAIEGAPPAAFD
jgi:lipid A ethanolaminephosphotransferase